MKKHFCLLLISTCLISLILNSAYGNVVNKLDTTYGVPAAVQENIVTEVIYKIAPTGRVLILSNQNRAFNKGDFVSLIIDNKLVARTLIAKDISKRKISGIKILKIYNSELWKTIRPGLHVQVLKGDDSYFLKLLTNTSDTLIKNEEDLYNDTNLLEDDDFAMDENPNRAIKTDNVLGLSYGNLQSLTIDSDSGTYSHFMAHWAYQIADNIWTEITVGQVTVNDFPSLGLDTRFTNLSIKAKFSIVAPFDSYVLPYIGFQMITADSPGAGKDDGNTALSIRQQEESLVNDSESNKLIFGATILKRLVPGWFARLDIGNDLIAFGFALEF